MKISSSTSLSIVLGAILVTSVLLMSRTGGDNTGIGYSTASERQYDPWIDLNDDGEINIIDIFTIARLFGTTGAPINKTELLMTMKTDMFKSGLLLHLPSAATYPWPKPVGQLDIQTILVSLDLNQSELGNQQSIFVRKGTTITITGEFQIYDNIGGAIRQAFFIYSWTPSWPAPNSDYYHPLYNGGPGEYPGVKSAFNFDLTVPNEGGVYYLYFCSESKYNMEDAVNEFNFPLIVPYAIITVEW